MLETMCNLNEVKTILDKDLIRSKDQLKRIRKASSFGNAHSSYLDYAEGLVAGIECAIVVVDAQILKVKEQHEAYTRGINKPYEESSVE